MAVVSRVEVVAVGGCYALYGLKKLFSVHFFRVFKVGNRVCGPYLVNKNVDIWFLLC